MAVPSRKMGTDVPRFAIPDHPELERALNLLGDSVRRIQPVRLYEGRFVQVTGSQEEGYYFDLKQNPTSLWNCPFRVVADVEEQRFYVHPGHVAVSDTDTRLFIPYIPTIGSDRLDAKVDEGGGKLTPPYFAFTGLTAGAEYWVLVVFDEYNGEVVMHNSGTPFEAPPGKWVLRIGQVKLIVDGTDKVLDPTFGETETGADDGGIIQDWESDILVCCDAEASSSVSASSASSASSAQKSKSGSDKSNAIVPCTFHQSGYCALYTLECPDVRFEDVMRFDMDTPTLDVDIDPRFAEVCAKGSIEVCGCVPSRPVRLGASVKGFKVHMCASGIYRWLPWKTTRVVVRLTALRKGFAQGKWRFAPRTENQFMHNERFINSAYPKEEIPQ